MKTRFENLWFMVRHPWSYRKWRRDEDYRRGWRWQ
jgi:hypothetical protein